MPLVALLRALPALGVSDARADAVRSKAQALALILEHPATDIGRAFGGKTLPAVDGGASRRVELRVKLALMKVRTLQKRAEKCGLAEEALDDALESQNPKQALVDMLLAHELPLAGGVAARRKALRDELRLLKVRALEKRAEGHGVAERRLDDALEGPNPKDALVELLLARELPSADAMEAMLGPTLLTEGGEVPTSEALAGKAAVALYFSAHWCPHCRGYTRKLAQLYNDVYKAKGMEVIFVSSDRDEGAFGEYFGEQPWLALPFGDRKRKNDLSKKFTVSGIPSLVILSPDGEVITKDGRGKVGKPEQYPWIVPSTAMARRGTAGHGAVLQAVPAEPLRPAMAKAAAGGGLFAAMVKARIESLTAGAPQSKAACPPSAQLRGS